MFETLVTTNELLAKTRLITSGWGKDTAPHRNDFRMVDAGENTGFKQRSNGYRDSAKVTQLVVYIRISYTKI